MISIITDMRRAFPGMTIEVRGNESIYINGSRTPPNWGGCTPKWSNIHYMVGNHANGATIPRWFWQKYPLPDHEVLSLYGTIDRVDETESDEK